jgi:hypothetical protein
MTRVSPLALVSLALLAGCRDRELSLCDITQSDCQEDVYYADLRLRDDGYDPFAGIPPIRTIDEAQYRSELESRAAAAPSPAAPWWDAALALLHLLPSTGDANSNLIDNQVKNTAAYYDQTARKVTIIAHPAKVTDDETRVRNTLRSMDILAHELVHALQDRELDLNTSPTSSDGDFARRALIEGDASLYDYLFYGEAVAQAVGGRMLRPNPLDYFTYWRDVDFSDDPKQDGNFASLGPPLLAAYWTVYPLGGIWLASRWNAGGNDAVRHAYGEAPQRSLDFLLPPGSTPPPEIDIYCAPAVPNEYRNPEDPYGNYGRDRFGAIDLFAYLMAFGVPSAESLAGALLWRNDLIFVYYNPATQKTAVAWRFELASPLPGSVLAKLTTAGGPVVLQEGSTLLVTASDDETLKATWAPGTACP